MNTSDYHHNSANPSLTLRSIAQVVMFRPRGLWFARGNVWLDWAARPASQKTRNARIHAYNYAIDLGDSKVVRLATRDDVIEFTDSFGCGSRICWRAAAEYFDGIELTSPAAVRTAAWSQSFDVPSGCLWNTGAALLFGSEHD